MRWMIFVLACMSTVAFSQTLPVVDVKLAIVVDPPSPWRIGQVGTVSMNVTNLSATQGTVALIQNVPAIPPNTQTPDGFDSISESCPRNGECTAFGKLCWGTPPINPGATVSCVFTLRAEISRNRPGRDRLFAYTDPFLYSFFDPDLSNNTVQIELAIVPDILPAPLPAPVAPASYLLMLVLIGGVGVFALRGRS